MVTFEETNTVSKNLNKIPIMKKKLNLYFRIDFVINCNKL